MFDCISIVSDVSSDDDEVEVIDQFINLERGPVLVDLTYGDTPKPKKRPREPEPISPHGATTNPQDPLPHGTAQKPITPPPQESNPKPQPRSPHETRPKPQPPPVAETRPKPQPPPPPETRPRTQNFTPPDTRPKPQPPTTQEIGPKPQPTTLQENGLQPHPSLPHKTTPKPPSLRNPLQKPQQHPVDERELMRTKKELGNKLFRCNDLDQAIRNYKEASELAKKLNDQEMSAILHFNLAMSYDRLNLYNQAVDECAAAVKLDDKYIKAHVKRAEIYMSCGKFDEAVICYEHICELDSTKKDDAMRRIAQAREYAKTKRHRDQYEILGLRPNFSLEDLRAAYKRMARTHHPDKHSDADVVTRRIEEKYFKEASEAYTFFRKRYGA